MRRCALGMLLIFSLASVALMAADEPDAATRRATGPAGIWETMRDIVPRQYVCLYTAAPLQIDGKADEPAWQAAPWTDDFVDIEGDLRPKPRFRTRAKMLWDDKYFYVHAELEEPHVWGTITRQNQVMFNDNDFEVFIDPDGNNHGYYEFEMNALNTTWELSLDKPYRDGGPARDPSMLAGLKTAVHVRGTINDPRDTDEGWSVEIAFPWEALQHYAGSTPCPPVEGNIWRVGFSRVEWLVDIINGKYQKIPREMRAEDNWIWSPQGIIDMHRPERWGQVQFTRKAPAEATFVQDPTFAAREQLMELYHRQKVFQAKHGRWAGMLNELGLGEAPVTLTLTDGGYRGAVEVRLPDGVRSVTVREDSGLEVDAKPQAAGKAN